jgi:GAF domain-containing protein
MNLQFLYDVFLSSYPTIKGFSLIKMKPGGREVICDIQIEPTQNFLILPLNYETKMLGELVLRSHENLNISDSDKAQLNGVFAPLLNGDLSTQMLSLSWVRDIYAQLKPHQRDWVGIYWKESFINSEKQGSTDLVVGPYIGPWTPHVRIGIDAGLCGLAVREGRTVNVDDVRADARFLACSAKTRSEIVIPIADSNGQIVGELDIDSNEIGAFDRMTEMKLQDFVSELKSQLQI